MVVEILTHDLELLPLFKRIKMGKGDKKTYKGKLFKGSYGVKRPRKKKNNKSGVKNSSTQKAVANTSSFKVATKTIASKSVSQNNETGIKNNSTQTAIVNSTSPKVAAKDIAAEIVPQKSKNDEKREKIFDIFKNHLNFLNDKGFVSTEKDVYLCPLDLKPHHNVYEEDPLSLEDAPPKSLGGKAHVLTCTSCNNDRGHDIDADLAKFIKEAKIVNTAFNLLKAGKPINKLLLPKSDHDVTMELNGEYIDGKMGFKKNGEISMTLPVKLSPNTVLNFVGSKVPKWAQYSLLKAAYILLFKKTGYTLLLDKCFDIVREQIENPEKNIYPENFCRITSKDNVLTKNNKEVNQGVYFVQDKGLECMLVVFDIKLGGWEKKILVFLPLPVRDLNSALTNLRAKLAKGKGQTLELYPQEQDRDHAGDYLMKEDNLEAMYNWIEVRKKEANQGN